MPELASIPAALIEPANQALMALIAQGYVLPRDSSVTDFLASHPQVARLLRDATPHLRQHFGEIAFALRSPTDEFGWECIYVDALWPGDAKDAIVAIDAFEDAWWIANSQAAAGNLTFTYRLI